MKRGPSNEPEVSPSPKKHCRETRGSTPSPSTTTAERGILTEINRGKSPSDYASEEENAESSASEWEDEKNSLLDNKGVEELTDHELAAQVEGWYKESGIPLITKPLSTEERVLQQGASDILRGLLEKADITAYTFGSNKNTTDRHKTFLWSQNDGHIPLEFLFRVLQHLADTHQRRVAKKRRRHVTSHLTKYTEDTQARNGNPPDAKAIEVTEKDLWAEAQEKWPAFDEDHLRHLFNTSNHWAVFRRILEQEYGPSKSRPGVLVVQKDAEPPPFWDSKEGLPWNQENIEVPSRYVPEEEIKKAQKLLKKWCARKGITLPINFRKGVLLLEAHSRVLGFRLSARSLAYVALTSDNELTPEDKKNFNVVPTDGDVYEAENEGDEGDNSEDEGDESEDNEAWEPDQENTPESEDEN